MNTYSGEEIVDILKNENDKDITLRTIRHYTSIGLIPKCEMKDRKRVYTDEHLEKLRAIRTMKKTGGSLTDIKHAMDQMSNEAITRVGSQISSYMSTSTNLSYIAEKEEHFFNPEISMTFHKNVSAELKQKIITNVSNIIKGEL